ncbi:hypothetical protein ACFPZ0_04040 [Streptomonospora nanhaiensis]|uniref:hypothetical protein n=1 Tax=Streptomonospora nanhaiensis TaxID=1323731 RepID=UPI001C996286|nr:hypothetical protein [Streptomonospora nanhaiensis]MBX9388166.1 hypothetical protein [Streptomonospora nanhaiensis]
MTALEVDPVPRAEVYGGGLFFAAERAAEVLHAWRAWTAGGLPVEMNSSVALLRAPDAPWVPAPLRGRLTAHVRVAFTGGAERGAELVRPLRGLGPALIDTVRTRPYTAIAGVHDDPTEPMPYDERSAMLAALDGAAVDALVGAAGPGRRVPFAMVEVRHLGGALAREPEVPNAVGHRGAAYSLSVLTPAAPADGGAGAAAAEELLARMAPWATGLAFLDFLGGPEAGRSARPAYTPEDLARLRRIRAVHDPGRLFQGDHG